MNTAVICERTNSYPYAASNLSYTQSHPGSHLVAPLRESTQVGLIINRMFVYEHLNGLNQLVTLSIYHLPGQSRPRSARTIKLVKSTREKLRRNPKRSLRNLAKEDKVSIGTMSTILHTGLQTSPCKHQKKQLLTARSVEKRKAKSRAHLTSYHSKHASELGF